MYFHFVSIKANFNFFIFSLVSTEDSDFSDDVSPGLNESLSVY